MLTEIRNGFSETVAQSHAPRTPVRWISGVKLAMVFVDAIAAAIGIVLADTVVTWHYDGHAVSSRIYVALLALAIFPIAFAQQGLYYARHLDRRAEELRRLVNASVIGTIGIAGVSVAVKIDLSRTWIVVVAVFVLIAVGLDREVVRRIVRSRRASGRMVRRVILVGDNEEADELNDMLASRTELGYEVVGRVSDKPIPESDTTPRSSDGQTFPPYLGRTDTLLEVVRSTGSSGVVVATTDIDLETANRLVRILTSEGVYVELSSSMRDIATRRVTIRPLGRYPVMSVEPVSRSGWRTVLKRAFDVTCSALGLLALSPILVLAAIGIRVNSRGKVLFRQTRVGRFGEPFTVYKFRTMVPNAEDLLPELMAHNEASGPMFKMADDPRVTRPGRLLRRTSIDELPQLLNVLKGDMSLVGPRPALPHEAMQWNDDLRERLRVKPGITGNWQVNGRFQNSLEDYQRLDLFYVDNWSMVTDLVILAKTIPAVLRRNGAA